MALADLKESGQALLSDLPPWGVISSKVLAQRLGVDVYAFGQWRYRGLLPPAVPDDAIKGRVNGYLVADFQSWLDPSLSPLQRFREALRPLLGEEADTASDDLICIYAAVEAGLTEPVGLTFTTKGSAIVSTFIRQLTR